MIVANCIYCPIKRMFLVSLYLMLVHLVLLFCSLTMWCWRIVKKISTTDLIMSVTWLDKPLWVSEKWELRPNKSLCPTSESTLPCSFRQVNLTLVLLTSVNNLRFFSEDFIILMTPSDGTKTTFISHLEENLVFYMTA